MTVSSGSESSSNEENGNDSIPFLPDVPEEILYAAQRGKLAVFVGAGVSCLAGSPDWNGFANGMLKKEVEKGSGANITNAELDQISHLNPKIKLFIARETGSLSSDDYKVVLEPNKLTHVLGISVYQDIHSISNQIVTTNYDTWLDSPLPAKVEIPKSDQEEAKHEPSEKKVFYKSEEITPLILHENSYVVHLHGSLNEPDTMVMTTADYIQHYKREDSNPIPSFLDELFNNRTVLFVGYGLGELEILEFILSKKGSSSRHFILQGYYSHQNWLSKHMGSYFNEECQVRLIPFNMDSKGYEALADVLNDWATQINPEPLLPLDKRMEAEEWLDG